MNRAMALTAPFRAVTASVNSSAVQRRASRPRSDGDSSCSRPAARSAEPGEVGFHGDDGAVGIREIPERRPVSVDLGAEVGREAPRRRRDHGRDVRLDRLVPPGRAEGDAEPFGKGRYRAPSRTTSSGSDQRSRRSGPTVAARNSAASATVRVSGP